MQRLYTRIIRAQLYRFSNFQYTHCLFKNEEVEEVSAESRDKLSMDRRQARRFGKWKASKVLNVTKIRNYERCTSRPAQTFSMLPFSLFPDKLFVAGVGFH